ncbi:methyl-accepting chemotaxis protein [Brachyspira hampsonii]|uniref:methyl-accepting chemotaxis protein n=1 Tax=Brachyspira hampsonii TaxID=1287055 RepID=UPI000D34598C|nr:methyl-accepting chemotaxis protein [Brachyspira hampsonii]PTY39146.1 chemotaxis protein [Brachyspira hampsonii bv. II]
MGIKIRIILIIVGVMVLVAFSTNFLSNTLNTETFSAIIENSLDNRFNLIEKEFEYNIISAREESAKISTTLSVVYNNIKNMDIKQRDEYFQNFLSATVNESQLYFNRIVSILFHPQSIGDGNERFTLYRYSTFNKEFTKINTTNKIMWDTLTNNYNQIYKSILRRQILKPYMINEGQNVGITFNISSTIPDIENEERIVGIANVGVLFNYSSDIIKDILSIEGSDIMVIDKKNSAIINSQNSDLINARADVLFPQYYEIFNANLATGYSRTDDVELNGKLYRSYVTSIAGLINIVMLIPHSYYTAQIKDMNNTIFYTIIIAFLMAIVTIIFFIKLLFSSITKISDAIGNSVDNKDLTVKIPTISGGDEIGEMTKWVGLLNNSLQSVLSSVKRTILTSKKQSDTLSQKISANLDIIYGINNNIEVIKNNVNEELNQVEIVESSNQNMQEYITSNTDNIDLVERDTRELQNKIIEEGENIEQIAASVEEMSKTIENIDSIISKATNKAKDLSLASVKSKEKMQATSMATGDLRNALGFISNFVSSIRNIAHQTNLLAMNAAIEAAHAGKYSSGFAVVAEEIRKLSEVSNEQADNANKVLQNIEEKIIITTNDLTESTEQFDVLTKDVQEVTEIMDTVHVSSVEQLKAINEIVASITKISQSSEHIKTQYIDMADKLGNIRNSLESLNNISISTSKTMNKLKNISESIHTSVISISDSSNDLSASANTMNKFANDNNKLLSELETEISQYKIRDMKTKKDTVTQRVKGITLIILKEFIKTKFGEEGYQKWVTAMEPSSALIFKNEISSKEWYPYTTSFDKPYRLVCDLFYAGTNTGIKDISEYHFKQIVPKYLRPLLFFLPKHFILSYAAEHIFTDLFDPARIELIKARKKLLVVHLVNFNEDPEVIELAILSWATLLLESATHIRATMEITKSIKDGEFYTEFVLKW